MKNGSWTELSKSVTSRTSWASWRTGEALGGVFGGWASWTSSGWLPVVSRIRCGSGLLRPSLTHVGNMPSSWSRFLTEGTRTDNRPSGWKMHHFAL
ncbi:hypothetical protein F2Q70_00005332 [Brassica cretica]|uniref:Uncharacterized protein n=1 Tax=Brassica cretica TaxID=69181 RepID=A0A8S9IQV5_BRACR|nr:hypothetical protein F2Q68_00021961 [Brassica cretica]KAF2572430.1 hypothetical protein F2Q70_00005332 [Brassica cretica]